MIYVKEVKKNSAILAHAFGRAVVLYSAGRFSLINPGFKRWEMALVRSDLPSVAKTFVVCHECYHLGDKRRGVLMREIRANFYAALRHPWGFLVTAFLSLSLDRLKFYKSRIKNRK